MVAKIEPVARVKAISEDNRQRFNSGRERQSFADQLRRVLNKKTPAPKPQQVPEAYDLELTSCGTHSLFYSSGLSLEALLR